MRKHVITTRMTRITFIGMYMCALCISLLTSCAKETSADKKKQEDADRAYSRLEKVFGDYTGYIKRNNDSMTPTALNVSGKRNAVEQGEMPTLLVSLTTGFFGGVSIASENASFNWSSGSLVASFKRSAGAPLELRAVLNEDRLDDGMLVGPNLGTLDAFFERGPNKPSLDFGSFGQDEVFFSLKMVNSSGYSKAKFDDAIVSFKRQTKDQPASADMDLPMLPPLSASVSFPYLAATPQSASKVLYDPLTGSIRIFLDDSDTEIDIEDVFLNSNFHLKSDSFSGTIISDAQTIGHVVATEISKKAEEELPPRAYIGTLAGAAGTGLKYKVIAFLEYLRSRGTNSKEFPFPSFPNMRLKLVSCLGGQPFAEADQTLIAMDYMNQKARFKSSYENKILEFQLTYSDDWSELEGHVRTAETSASDEENEPKLTLHATGTASVDCSVSVPQNY